MTCGILVPSQELNLGPQQWKLQVPNHWTLGNAQFTIFRGYTAFIVITECSLYLPCCTVCPCSLSYACSLVTPTALPLCCPSPSSFPAGSTGLLSVSVETAAAAAAAKSLQSCLDSVRPHRWQPTRLPRPWDSPGKNTGVGCHFLLQCMRVKSESEVAQCVRLPATPWIAAYQAPPSMGFSRQEYWSGVPLPSLLLSLRTCKLRSS